MCETPVLECGHFRAFRPGVSIWHTRHVVRHGHLSIKQLKQSLTCHENNKLATKSHNSY